MASSVNIGNTWKDVDSISANIGGAWKNVESGFVKVGGVWKEFLAPAGYTVFLDSNPNTNTGGWYYIHYDGPSTGSISVQSTYLSINFPYWSNGGFRTTNNFDLSQYSSMDVHISSSASGSYCYASINWSDSGGTRTGYNIVSPSNTSYGRKIVNIPLTGAGNGPLEIAGANTNGSVYLYGIELIP